MRSASSRSRSVGLVAVPLPTRPILYPPSAAPGTGALHTGPRLHLVGRNASERWKNEGTGGQAGVLPNSRTLEGAILDVFYQGDPSLMTSRDPEFRAAQTRRADDLEAGPFLIGQETVSVCPGRRPGLLLWP